MKFKQFKIYTEIELFELDSLFLVPFSNTWITTATFKVYLKFRLTSNCFFSEGLYEVKA